MAARITWLGHSTVLIALGGARVLTDPVLRPRVAHLVRHGPVPALPDGLSAVLVSHLHRDHADTPTLRRVPSAVPVIAPRGAAAGLARGGRRTVRELDVGDAVEVAPGVGVHAVPARHAARRNPLGADAGALGFVVAGGGTRVYFAGDTELFSEMARIGEPHLDVALLPVWGWGPKLGAGHLDPEGAARAAALLGPAVAIPIHWGTYLPAGLARRHRHLLRDPGPAFAQHAARVAPNVRVVVLAPGESFEL